MGRKPWIDHDARAAQVLGLIDGRRSATDIARSLHKEWDLTFLSALELVASYVRRHIRTGKVDRNGTNGRPYRVAAQRIPLPLVKEDEPMKAFKPSEVWTPTELLHWLSQLQDLPPNRVQELITPEQVTRAVAAARAATDEITRLKKEKR